MSLELCLAAWWYFTDGGQGGSVGPIRLCQCPCGWRKVLNDIGTSIWERLGSVLLQQRQGKRERCNQLALKWPFICISAAFTIFTHVPDGTDSHPQISKNLKRDIHLYSFNLPILVWRNGPILFLLFLDLVSSWYLHFSSALTKHFDVSDQKRIIN